MTIPEIKSLYLKKLSQLYPETEINTFFHLLLEEHFGIKRIDLALKPDLLNKDWSPQVFEEALSQLVEEKPIQYVLGKTEFAGMVFQVNEYVLIPRPETEELVQWILDSLATNKTVEIPENPLRILDIGTGSGCIPITLALGMPNAEVHALDVSKKALEVVRDNALSLGAKVRFFEMDVLTSEQLPEKYDVIVSNPPYVRMSEKSQMRGNVLKHEPELALFVKSEDPLLFYRKIGSLGREALRDNGMLFFEINENLAEQTFEILTDLSYQRIEIRKDIYGKDRMIRAFKK